MAKQYGRYWLCGQCRKKVFKTVPGKCVGNIKYDTIAGIPKMQGCGGSTSYAAYKWCYDCAKKYNICNSCGVSKP